MTPVAAVEIVYPSSDGEPMADNMKQARWMGVLHGNLDCFVGCNNFWYPRQGEPDLRIAPDVYVAFGRPRGDRDSYKQWEENDTPVTVVFEVWSPGNNKGDMEEKYTFYTEFGVEEYYIYDPYRGSLEVYLRKGTALRRHWQADGFISPRMGIRFDLSSGPELTVWRPDGRKFLTHAELDEERLRIEAARQQAEDACQQAEAARQQAEAARQQAEDARAGRPTPAGWPRCGPGGWQNSAASLVAASPRLTNSWSWSDSKRSDGACVGAAAALPLREEFAAHAEAVHESAAGVLARRRLRRPRRHPEGGPYPLAEGQL